MISTLVNLLISAIAVFAAAYLLPGVELDGFTAALITALVLGIANAVIRPILNFLAFPINLLTLGLFSLVINAAIVMLVAYLVPGFAVSGFLDALLFSILLSLISGLIYWIF